MSEKERLPLLLDEYAVCDVRSVNLYIGVFLSERFFAAHYFAGIRLIPKYSPHIL